MRTLPVALLAVVVVATGIAVASTAGVLAPHVAVTLVATCGLAIVVLVVAGSIRPDLEVFGPVVSTGRPEHQAIALTFDDGPDPASTPDLLAALHEADARATFFVLADRAEAYPELLRAISRRHEVGVHGLTHHPWLTVRSVDRGAAELREASDKIASITGKTPRWFRPPFGVVSPRLHEAARRADLTVVWCSLRTGDGGPMAQETLRERCRKANPGDIVLLHEGRRAARDALRDILGDLRQRGLRVVPVGELIR